MPVAKRHHFVPRAYLERFGRDGRVAVRWRDGGGLIVTGVQNIAVKAGFYRTERPDGSVSVEVEDWLADIDGAAIRAIRSVVEAEEPPAAGSPDVHALAVFLATQMKRTPEARERALFPGKVIKYADGRAIDPSLMAEYLEEVHLGFRPNDGEVQGALTLVQYAVEHGDAPTETDAIAIVMSGVEDVAGVLLEKNWSLEVARKPKLITSDAPMVIWRRPTAKDKYSGVGVGNAEEIRFPLDAGHQLVLSNRPTPATTRIEPGRVRACNLDIAASCHKFIIGHPDHQQRLREITLATNRPTARFNMAPGYQKGPDGEALPIGDVLHMWVQRSAPSTPTGNRRSRPHRHQRGR